MFRSVLTNPTFLKQVARNATALSLGLAEVLSPIEVAFLQRVALGAPEQNDNFAAYINDTLPSSISAAGVSSLPVSVTIRNDGWNTLAAPAPASSSQEAGKARGISSRGVHQVLGLQNGYAVEVNVSTVVSMQEHPLRQAGCQDAVERAARVGGGGGGAGGGGGVLPVCGVQVSEGSDATGTTAMLPISQPIRPGGQGSASGMV